MLTGMLRPAEETEAPSSPAVAEEDVVDGEGDTRACAPSAPPATTAVGAPAAAAPAPPSPSPLKPSRYLTAFSSSPPSRTSKMSGMSTSCTCPLSLKM